MACDAPDSLIGTETGPLRQTEGVVCQVRLDNTVTTSQFFGYRTRESNQFSTRRGSVDFVSSFVSMSGGNVTRDQFSACMDAMAEELAATTAPTALPSPGLDGHFRLTCGQAGAGGDA